MEKLRIEKKDIYTIEVNDNGDTIEFDLVDIELPFKLNDCFLEIEKIQRDLKNKEIIIKKKQDKQAGPYSANQLETLKVYKQAFCDMRKAMDKFLGEGGCQKIFGDRNYLNMFDDLFEALEPHLQKMELNVDKIKERIKAKYSKKEDNVLK